MVAQKVGISGVEFHRRNMVRQGSVTITGQKLNGHKVAMEQALETVLREIDYEKKLVKCAHGNTVGRLDEDALFYARQRGLPEAEAKALLTEAFIGEGIDRIEHDGAREIARAWAAERLRG